jgi:hypothetical protein
MVKVKALLENAAKCRQEAGDFILGQHSELAGPLMWGAVMDSLLALALIARASEAGARRRHLTLKSAVDGLLDRLPDLEGPMGTAGDPEALAWPALRAEPVPEPVGESSARLLWLADRLIDGAWHQGLLSEVSDILRRFALSAPSGTKTAAPGGESPAPGLERGAGPAPPSQPSPIPTEEP